MALGVGSGFWGLIIPSQKTNYIQNPSGEYGTVGWGTVQAGTVGTTAQFQQYGAWAGSVAPTSNGTSGAYFGTFTAANGSAYTISAYVKGANGVPYHLCVTDTSNANRQGSVPFTGGGTWQRVSYSFTEASGGVRRVIVQKASGADTSAFYVDGVQAEDGSLTTYIDGDQPGCQWLGATHNSISVRDDQYRGGGSLIALSDLGWQVDQMPGAGVPPVENSSQSYAIVDGAQFQRTRVATRTLTLTAAPISGTSTQDFHILRRTIWDTLKPDLTTPTQPVRFVYVGGQGTQQVDAYYDRGFELGNMNGPMAENFAMSFIATDPYWYAPTQQGTALDPRVAIGSTNFIARRSPTGEWGTLGVNGTTVAYNAATPVVRALQFNTGGTLFLAGNWGTVAGTISPHIGMHYPLTNTFGTLAGGTIENGADGIYALATNPSGTLFFSGQFSLVAGTTTFHVARWTGAFGTLTGGTVSGPSAAVIALLYSPIGTLILGGNFGTVGGTLNSNDIAFWTGAYGSLGAAGVGSAIGEGVNALAWGLDNRIYIGGNFTNVGGTIGTSIGFFKKGSFGTMGNATGNAIINALGVGPNGILYEAGFFTGFNGGTTTNTAQFNGVQHAAMGAGLGNLDNLAHAMAVDQVSGDVYVGGAFSNIGSVNVASNYAKWIGYSFVPPDITISTPGTIWAMAVTSDRTLYIAGNFSGTGQAASIGTIINSGRAAAYPTLRLRNLSASGTGRIYQMLNNTTDDQIYFNYTMLAGETAELVLTPGDRSFTSNFQGNVFGAILPGSNVATWRLLPGTNYLSFFADSDNIEASLYWTPRGWSADSGTVY